MDTSPEYVMMCQKAFPDDKIENFTHIVRIKGSDFKDCILVDQNGQYWFHQENPTRNVHLKTQDQLQEMMGERVDILLAWFYDFCGSDYFHTGSDFFVETVRIFTSMEQLWLAFVMSEKYQKTWDTGKEVWVALD